MSSRYVCNQKQAINFRKLSHTAGVPDWSFLTNHARVQPHADVEKLADAGLGRQEPDDPAAHLDTRRKAGFITGLRDNALIALGPAYAQINAAVLAALIAQFAFDGALARPTAGAADRVRR